MKIREKINIFRELLEKHELNGYLISTNDEYFNEYILPASARLSYITEFTGSNGIALICLQHALFFTDGRYIEQAKKELDQEIFTIIDQGLLNNFTFEKYLTCADKIGFDPKIFNDAILEKYFAKLNLVSLDVNLIDSIWSDKPAMPNSAPYLYHINYSGKSSVDKIAQCREIISSYKASSLILYDSETTCWLLNIRGDDFEYSPILLARSIITLDKIYLFTNITRNLKALNELEFEVNVLDNNLFEETILALNGTILCDINNCSIHLKKLIKTKEYLHITNPCILWKACKNNIEIDNLKEVHIQDSAALCNFLYYVTNTELGEFTEYELGIVLTNLRKERKNYIKSSFPIICGYQENSAIIHYRANENFSKKLINSGILLIDSGGHYLGGTTDITRTICLGTPTEEQKYYYTKVLKGHLAINMLKFPQGYISGANIDVLARQYLWQDYADYQHGTGHGVGNFLNVHEGPSSIRLNNYVILEKNMVLSNEPGYYKSGEYGIRIENLVYVEEAKNESFMQFNTLNFVPYAKNLIIFSMLNKDEINYLNEYYKQIREKISPIVDDSVKKWIKYETTEFV